jgi:hypothetical protein
MAKPAAPSTHRLSEKNNAAELPDEKAPIRPKDLATGEDKTLSMHAKSRSDNEKLMRFPLDDFGAVGKVRSGNTPLGPPKQQLKFKKGQPAQP